MSVVLKSVDDSVLHKEITLHDLLEQESLHSVMVAFVDAERIGVRVFDTGGNKLVDLRGGSADFYGYLGEHEGTRQACASLFMALQHDPLDTRDGVFVSRTVDCFSGLRYVVSPLHYERELMGRLIFGPYLPEAKPQVSERLHQIGKTLDRTRVDALVLSLPRISEERVAQLMTQMKRVIEVLTFTSHRSLLAQQLHIESTSSTHRELAEKNRALAEQSSRVQELDNLKSNFLATISHELRTPLTSIIGYSELLLEGLAGNVSDQQKEYVKTIMDKGEGLMVIIGQLLDLSYVGSGSLHLHASKFSLKELLEESATSVAPRAQKKRITVEQQLADDLPQLTGDKKRIGQIVVNLLDNAVKFTPPGGKITVRCARSLGRRSRPQGTLDDGAAALFDLSEESFVRIDVIDTGAGIAREMLDKVFLRFFQVDNSPTRAVGGIGLGLSIVKAFVSAHQGQILVDSKVGEGSTFSVLLPVD
jgi:signal transduction histidine kinase